MKWTAASLWIIAFAVLAILGTVGIKALAGGDGRGSGFSTAPGSSLLTKVTRVVDGDTIVVEIGGSEEKVRYIGIDTPETKKPNTPVQCFGKAASRENERLVADKPVRLVFDAEPRDRYGRLLAYVYRSSDDLFVNSELVRMGFAKELTFPPNVRFKDLFSRLVNAAKSSGIGLWGQC